MSQDLFESFGSDKRKDGSLKIAHMTRAHNYAKHYGGNLYDEELSIAILLHDTIEDTRNSTKKIIDFSYLQQIYGDKVALLVEGVTKPTFHEMWSQKNLISHEIRGWNKIKNMLGRDIHSPLNICKNPLKDDISEHLYEHLNQNESLELIHEWKIFQFICKKERDRIAFQKFSSNENLQEWVKSEIIHKGLDIPESEVARICQQIVLIKGSDRLDNLKTLIMPATEKNSHGGCFSKKSIRSYLSKIEESNTWIIPRVTEYFPELGEEIKITIRGILVRIDNARMKETVTVH